VGRAKWRFQTPCIWLFGSFPLRYSLCWSQPRSIRWLCEAHRANIMITAMLCLFCLMTGGSVGFIVAAILASGRKADQRHLAMTGYEQGGSEPN